MFVLVYDGSFYDIATTLSIARDAIHRLAPNANTNIIVQRSKITHKELILLTFKSLLHKIIIGII